MEIASVLAGTRGPMVGVSGEADRADAPTIGVVTAAQPLERLLPARPGSAT
ncbi:hypothetical protein [Actinomadura macra]|uniref:hypothetical protein n=1 Tax=Actinomadura macra TaxID=46164 RepID=UPI000AAFA16E|nr:hypothetical protein [Actinomadura macra]